MQDNVWINKQNTTVMPFLTRVRVGTTTYEKRYESLESARNEALTLGLIPGEHKALLLAKGDSSYYCADVNKPALEAAGFTSVEWSGAIS